MKLSKQDFRILMYKKIKKGLTKKEAFEETAKEVKYLNKVSHETNKNKKKETFKEQFTKMKSTKNH